MGVMMKVKDVAWHTAHTPAFAALTRAMERFGEPNNYLLRVLTYHRVAEPGDWPDLYPGLISATPDMFRRQMEYLAAECNPLAMGDLLRIVREGDILPPRSVLVTFDDAYRDFAEVAWPVMKRYDVPATLFVPTAYPDQPGRTFFWDRIHVAVRAASGREELNTALGVLPIATAAERGRACHRLNQFYKRLPDDTAAAFLQDLCADTGAPETDGQTLGWGDLRALTREGVSLGSHSCRHQILTQLAREQVSHDVRQSFADLDREIGPFPRLFAYPAGILDDEVLSVLEDESVELAFTTERGINDLRRLEALQVRRIHVGQRTTLPILRAQLAPVAMSVNRWLEDRSPRRRIST